MPIMVHFYNEANECIDEMYFDFESEYFRFLALTKRKWHKIITFISTGFDYDGYDNWMVIS